MSVSLSKNHNNAQGTGYKDIPKNDSFEANRNESGDALNNCGSSEEESPEQMIKVNKMKEENGPIIINGLNELNFEEFSSFEGLLIEFDYLILIYHQYSIINIHQILLTVQPPCSPCSSPKHNPCTHTHRKLYNSPL